MKRNLPNFQRLSNLTIGRSFFILIALLLFSLSADAQLSVTLQTQPPICGGFSTGIITAIPSGGASPYSYLWSNGETSNPITNLPIGSYTVTVTDTEGSTASATAILTSPLPIVADIEVLDCGLPGILIVNASGGVPPFEYEWSNGETTELINNLDAGEYCVTVSDQNACGYVTCETVAALLTVEVETTPAVCGSSEGGTATAIITGGVSPLEILWSTGETTMTIENLAPGTYTVAVVAANDCLAEASGTVGIQPGDFDFDFDLSQPTCAGNDDGEITANVSGGLEPYEYEWSNGETTQTISDLPPGNYSLTVTDVIGCTSTSSVSLSNQSDISLVLTSVNPTCAGADNGSVSAFPSNGVSPYEYLWNTDDTTQQLSNVGAGTYTVTVTDDIGCTATATEILTAPPAFSVNVSATDASQCGVSDGSVSAMPTGGGSPPFSYLWSNGATNNVVNGIEAGDYTVTVTSSQGCTATGATTVGQPTNLIIEISGSSIICANANNGTLSAAVTYGNPPFNYDWSNGDSTATIENLAPGTYAVTVTSTEGCTGTADASISASPAIGLTLSPQNLTCFANASGQVTANASGGTAPLSYLWNTGSTMTSISNLPIGDYSVTITDANGCTTSASTELSQPTAIQITFDTNGSCGANGSAAADVNGGTPGYTYLWSNGETVSSIFGLAPGNYSLTVTDFNGCTKIQTANVPAFPLVELTVTSTNTTCNGTSDGTVSAEVTGGTAPFIYQWSNGANQSSQSGLTPGNYSVTVTDDNGCMAFGSAFIAQGAGLNVSIDAPTYVCPGTTVSATAIASGGTPIYTYFWSDGQTTEVATDLTAGNYSVVVSDPSSCTGSAIVLILPGGNFNVNSTVENVACFGDATGSIALNVAGGATPINYLWSNGATTSSIENLPAGNYTATVSDQTECEQILDFEITQSPELTLGIDVENGTCGNLGTASANPSGGIPGYTYLWSNGSTDATITNLPTGTYALTVTDANDCSATASASIEVVPSPTCEILLAQSISTIDGTDGQLTAQVTNGTAPFNYLWNDGQTSQTAINLAAGNYTVTVTDANACETTCNFTLLNPAKLGDFVWLDTDMDGIQDADEPGFEGVGMTLTGTDDYGNAVNMSASTDFTGMYMFLVQPGTYKITLAPPTDYILSMENTGGDDTIDSDVNPLTNMTPIYTIGEGEMNLTIDAGLFESPCENVTDPGTVCCSQTLCGPGLVPDPFTESSPATGGLGPIEYLWMYSTEPGPFDPGTWIPISDADGSDYAPGAIYETTYFVRCVRREGCGMFLESNQIVITISNDAVAEINGPTSTCVDEPVDFFATANPSGATYNWTFNGGEPSTANTQDVAGVVWNSFGVKTVTLSVENNGCTSYDTLLISVSNSPTFCGNALIINAEQVGQSSVEISWDYPSNDTSGLAFEAVWAPNQTDFEFLGRPDLSVPNGDGWHFEKMHTSPVRGSNFYRVNVTDEFGEKLLSNIVEVVISNDDFNLVHVYPNPFSDKLKIDIYDRFDTTISFDIYDALGRKVAEYEAPEEANYFEIPTAEMAHGAYFVFVKYGNSPQKIYKMIK